MFGDIITYLENDYFITHRIVGINNKKIITQGDRNSETDVQISKENVLGKVVFSSIILGLISKYLLKYILILLVVVMIIVSILNKKNNKIINLEKRLTK